MSIQSGRRQNATPWVAVFFALVGLLWCGYVAFPTSTVPQCITSGCEISQSFAIGGVSLWWVGGAYFFLLIVLCLRGRRYVAWRLSQLGLFLDILLLGLMFFTGPCFDCLVVAAFIGLTTWLLRPPAEGWFKGAGSSSLVMLPLWFGLLLGNTIVALNESLPRWVIANENSSSIIRVYFAPSCPWCREAVKILGAKEKALIYPVLEKDGDFEAIVRFKHSIENGLPLDQAIDKCLDEEAPVPKLSFTHKLVMRIQLLRNKSFLLKHPQRTMPLIEINGMPVSWLPSANLRTNTNGFNANTFNTGTPGLDGSGIDGTGTEPQTGYRQTGRGGEEGLPWGEGQGVKYCGEGTPEPCD